jgi:GT2 family glycosyltransferase
MVVGYGGMSTGSKKPAVSVLIPTHDRSQSLRRTLQALAAQTYPANHFETLVIANGCHDDTAVKVRALATPFTLRLAEIPTSNVSLARNTGAAIARGDLLVFVDDDVEPLPGHIQAHASAHLSAPNLIAMGPYLAPVLKKPPGMVLERLRRLGASNPEWLTAENPALHWEYFGGGGNFSIRKDLFEHVGGFDTAFSRYQDMEFAYRAEKHGARLIFLPAAGAYHYAYENRSLMQYLRITRTDGRTNVLIARRYPETFEKFPIARAARPRTALGHLARWLAFDHPRAGDLAANGLLLAGYALTGLRMQKAWNDLMDCLRDYWYFRGVADELGNRAALASYFSQLRAVSDETGLQPLKCQADSSAPQP